MGASTTSLVTIFVVSSGLNYFFYPSLRTIPLFGQGLDYVVQITGGQSQAAFAWGASAAALHWYNSRD